MNWLCLGKPDWDEHPDHIDHAAKSRPIGIAPHGALGEKLHRQKKHDVLTGLLKRIRDQGVLVGLSAHDPRLIETAEEKGGTSTTICAAFITSLDPRTSFAGFWDRICRWARSTCPPIRRECSRRSRHDASRAWSTRCWPPAGASATRPKCGAAFEEAFANIKPTDAVIVGMYQQLGDQVGENAAIVRSLCSNA